MDHFNSTDETFMYSSGTIQNNTMNSTDILENSDMYDPMITFIIVFNIFIVCLGLPLNCLAICGLSRLIRSNKVVPIYIINLLIADLLQVISKPLYIDLYFMELFSNDELGIVNVISELLLFSGLSASVWFMLCIALERYLVVAHPLWYRYHRSVRHTVMVSVAGWAFSSVNTFLRLLSIKSVISDTALQVQFTILFLLPFPLLVLFFVGTKRAIVGATSVRETEKRRILCMLALVLSTYIVLFLPFGLIMFITKYSNAHETVTTYVLVITSDIFTLNTLVDPMLYILLNSHIRRTLRSFPCCQRLFSLTEETENTATLSPAETTV